MASRSKVANVVTTTLGAWMYMIDLVSRVATIYANRETAWGKFHLRGIASCPFL
jgi:hypothetical protein